MISEVENRISQISRGDIPQGYKNTRVGIVPIEWEEVRFKELFTRLSRKNTEGNDNVLTISAQYGLINQKFFFNKDIASDDKSNYYLLYNGEFAYNKSYSNGYPFGAIKRLDMYDKGIVSPLYICFVASKENTCPDFYVHYFEGGKMNCEIQAFAQEGARNHGLLNIAVDDFLNSILLVPTHSEQQKIAEILTMQDKLIALKGRLIDELQKQKKFYLSKMFPKKGKNVPEIRFQEFTGDWEQRELGEVVDVRSGKDYKHLSEGDIPVFGTGGYMLSVNEALSYTEDAIGIGRKGTIDKPYILKAPFWTVDTLFYAVPRTNVDLNFAFDLFQNIDWKKKDESTGVPSLSKTAINEIDVLCPSYDEQQVLGNYFANLDCLITLHQRELEQEKKKKKALMQLLLNGIVRVLV